jgi:hypothetical protein
MLAFNELHGVVKQKIKLEEKYCHVYVCVTIDGVWVGEYIY